VALPVDTLNELHACPGRVAPAGCEQVQAQLRARVHEVCREASCNASDAALAALLLSGHCAGPPLVEATKETQHGAALLSAWLEACRDLIGRGSSALPAINQFFPWK
jgi:hypothetical protein